jgi:hypothetical protein
VRPSRSLYAFACPVLRRRTVSKSDCTSFDSFRYGGIYGLWLGSYYTVVISKPDLAKEAFVTKGKFTSDRAPFQSHGGHHVCATRTIGSTSAVCATATDVPMQVPSMYIATKDGKGIAMSSGDYWRKARHPERARAHWP